MYPEIGKWMKGVDKQLEILRAFDVPKRVSFPVTLFLHDDAADVATYEKLLATPGGGAEDTDTGVANNASGEVLIDAYISYPSTGFNTEVLLGGVWYFDTYLSVDSATVGVSRVVIRVYKRSSAGVETELFNVTTGQITTTTAGLYEVSHITPDIIVATTDRLVVKYYAISTSVPNRTITLYYEGTQHYSHIHTPIQLSYPGSNVSQFIPRTTYLYAAAWNPATLSTTALTLIDLSAVFDVPAGVKAVYVRVNVADSGSAGTDCYFTLGPSSTVQFEAISPMPVNSRVNRGQFIVPCNSDGDIYYSAHASGANTMTVVLQIHGYWI